MENKNQDKVKTAPPLPESQQRYLTLMLWSSMDKHLKKGIKK